MINKIIQLANKPLGLIKAMPEDLIAISARLAIAAVFWRSAQTKISGWPFLDQSWQFYNLNNITFYLFKNDYKFPAAISDYAAYLATYSEFFLSLAIALGLATRLSATALLGMTIVIQTFVYPGAWPTHVLWAASLLYIMKYGPGRLSLDHMFSRN